MRDFVKAFVKAVLIVGVSFLIVSGFAYLTVYLEKAEDASAIAAHEGQTLTLINVEKTTANADPHYYYLVEETGEVIELNYFLEKN